MKHYYLIFSIIIIILLLHFYTCYPFSYKEGNTTNKNIFRVGDKMAIGDFITSTNNTYMLGIFDNVIGIYKIPGDTTVLTETDNEGLQQDFLKNEKVKEVEIKGANTLLLKQQGLVVVDGANKTLWSSEISGLDENSTLELSNDGQLSTDKNVVVDLVAKGNIEMSTMENASTFEYILQQLSYNDATLKSKLDTFYENVDSDKLESFRNQFSSTFQSVDLNTSSYYDGLQEYVFNNLETPSGTNPYMLLLQIAKSFGENGVFDCSKYDGQDVFLYTSNGASLGDTYNEVIAAYNEMKTADLDDIYNYVSSNISTLSKPTYDIGTTQSFLKLTGIEKVLNQRFCQEGFSTMNVVVPFSSNIHYTPV